MAASTEARLCITAEVTVLLESHAEVALTREGVFALANFQNMAGAGHLANFEFLDATRIRCTFGYLMKAFGRCVFTKEQPFVNDEITIPDVKMTLPLVGSDVSLALGGTVTVTLDREIEAALLVEAWSILKKYVRGGRPITDDDVKRLIDDDFPLGSAGRRCFRIQDLIAIFGGPYGSLITVFYPNGLVLRASQEEIAFSGHGLVQRGALPRTAL